MFSVLRKKKKPEPKNILVIRFSSIGDIVLTTPVLRCIKHRYPNTTLHFLVKEKFKNVVIDNPYIDTIHTFDNNLEETIASVSKTQFDYIIDLHKNWRSLRVKQALKTKAFSFPKLNFQKWLYTTFKWNTLPDKSIVERYFEAVKKIDVKNDGQGLDYFIPEEKATSTKDIPFGHINGFVGCVIGGSFATKQFPVEKWKSLCAVIPYPIVLLGGPEDSANGELITAVDKGKIYNSCGKFDLTESADLVKRARVIISNDTGLMHIAAALKKPIISLWGNTTPWLGMFPYFGFNNVNHTIAPQSAIFEINNLSCRPCSKIGYQTCPKKHFKCMNLLDEIKIAAQVEIFWHEKKASKSQ